MSAGRGGRRCAGVPAGAAASDRAGEGRSHLSGRAVRAARPDADRGSVLLETALSVPALVAVAVAGLWLLSVGSVQLRAGDAARMAAREAARGQADAAVAAARAAMPDAEVDLRSAGGTVTVEVRRDVTAPVPFLQGLTFTVAARATAALEAPPGAP